MDKKKALRKLEELDAAKYWELGEVIQILKAVVKEMDDRDTREHVRMHMNAAIRESNDPRTSLRDLGEIMGCQEPTVMEQFCKWKDLDRKFTKSYPQRDEFAELLDVLFKDKQTEYLSFDQAIKVLLEDKKSISHVSWSMINRIDPYPNASGFLFWDGASHCSYFHFTTEMLHSGWIVLDR